MNREKISPSGETLPAETIGFSYFARSSNSNFKFQLSGKGMASELWGNGNSLWLAYTQQSFWQVFDEAHSRPFRESNYEPEVIVSHRYMAEHNDERFHLRVLNAGFVHQSNGQSNPRSRSWNRVYLQAGFENDFASGGKLIIQPKIWARFSEDPAKDDNSNITRYLGHGELQVRYLNHAGDKLNYQVSALARIRSLQVDIDKPTGGDFSWHFQYFTGYGESLLDYNQRHNTFGFGVSLTY